jgi:uncharacterized protein (DUF1684 family)
VSSALRIRTLTVLAAVILAGACRAGNVSYPDEINAWHAEKDRFMRESKDSPIQAERRGTFAPLSYFPVDDAYRVPAALTVARTDDVIEMPTSTGPRRQMRRIGRLDFTLKGQPFTLTAFVDATENDMRRLFVPFSDLTSGTETYTAGRYLDLDRTATGIYDLDFNRAYHPYCYYNPTYECPIPPRENRLKVPVRAGERMDPARPHG